MAKVVLTDEAKEDIRDLDRSAQIRVLRKLRELETEPEQRGQPLGSKAGGNLTGLRKLVVGDRQYRIVYQVERDGTVVVVWVIGERADDRCYELTLARLKMYANDAELTQNLQRLLVSAWNQQER
ncbi:type II toxin-antitoxin system RelE/ParE family toxin [Nocardia flavorosea]|uniref:type II toxin-antitoxin system RelE family toxin n=1 Tax=Nocardia flavorosea TaxID=53429 RepID=UPI001893B486|nr:type II toxin-antitoxin system RelE/ParE family toxin [Nocardia flavorosea]MBF6350326.1 type II toxin-antitoxin system RelE/ParE family toxin [Nocardia flavorosea]